MKKKSKLIIIGYLFIFCGIIVITFPYVLQKINQLDAKGRAESYDKNVEELNEEDIKNKINEANEYNINIYNNGTLGISLENIFDIKNNNKLKILGYIIIPKIHVNLPIYEGTGKNVLLKGIGHLENTSIPIGGKNTHSVLAGHTGLARAVMFDNLNKLEIGDIFYIKSLNLKLEYKVQEKNTILPNEIDKLSIKEGQDLVTLVTCIPKHVNTHRLLVTGVRNNY